MATRVPLSSLTLPSLLCSVVCVSMRLSLDRGGSRAHPITVIGQFPGDRAQQVGHGFDVRQGLVGEPPHAARRLDADHADAQRGHVARIVERLERAERVLIGYLTPPEHEAAD